MIKPTPAPHVTYPKLLFFTYPYAAVLAGLAIWQLVMFESFVSYLGGYLGNGTESATPLIALALIGMEVFALPFLLRLSLSPLARACSALLAFATPLAWAAVTTAGPSFNLGYLVLNVGFFLWGGLSFWVLGGPGVTRLSKKS